MEIINWKAAVNFHEKKLLIWIQFHSNFALEMENGWQLERILPGKPFKAAVNFQEKMFFLENKKNGEKISAAIFSKSPSWKKQLISQSFAKINRVFVSQLTQGQPRHRLLVFGTFYFCRKSFFYRSCQIIFKRRLVQGLWNNYNI